MSRENMLKGILVTGLLSLATLAGNSPARATDGCQPGR